MSRWNPAVWHLPASCERRPSSLRPPRGLAGLPPGRAASPRRGYSWSAWQTATWRCARPRSWALCTAGPRRLPPPDGAPTVAYCCTRQTSGKREEKKNKKRWRHVRQAKTNQQSAINIFKSADIQHICLFLYVPFKENLNLVTLQVLRNWEQADTK